MMLQYFSELMSRFYSILEGTLKNLALKLWVSVGPSKVKWSADRSARVDVSLSKKT